jgi:vacuolar-type H+-ATPase subunit E/Vma4
MQISFKKLKQRIKKIVENIKDKIHNIKENAKNKKSSIDEIINQIKTVKQFITSKTTKEAYAYGKKMVLKLLKHLAPNRIKGNLYMGFEESYLTGEALGALGMIYGIS